MTTLAALQHKTATLAQEARRRLPDQDQPVTLSALTALFTGDERNQLEAFLAEIEPHVGRLPGGNPDLSGLTNDELDELKRWATLAKEREDASKKAGKL